MVWATEQLVAHHNSTIIQNSGLKNPRYALEIEIQSAPQKSAASVVWVRNHVYPDITLTDNEEVVTEVYIRKINSLIIEVYITIISQVSSNTGNQTSSNFQPPNIHATHQKYIESSWLMGDSRGPYTDADDLHVSVWMISTHLS